MIIVYCNPRGVKSTQQRRRLIVNYTFPISHNRRRTLFIVCVTVVAGITFFGSINSPAMAMPHVKHRGSNWIGTWATAAQPAEPVVRSYNNQTLRLIVHTSIGGAKLRINFSNTYGDRPLMIGAAHIARRTTGAEIDPAFDRVLKFGGHSSTSVAPG